MLVLRVVLHGVLQVPLEQHEEGGEPVGLSSRVTEIYRSMEGRDLDTGGPPVHPARPQQGDLPEADSLAQRHEDDAVVGSADHLDRPGGHDEHLHPDISFLTHSPLILWREKYFPCEG